MDNSTEDLVARNRWMTISGVRLAGAVMAMFGLLAISDRIGLPEWSGYVLLFAGLVATFFMPTFLARKWRSPDQ